jgi:amidase
VLDVIAGYDPKDDQTVFSIGRKPTQPYLNSAAGRDLKGVRIGVLREYMLNASKADEQSLALAERAIEDLRKLGAVIVDPGPGGELFRACLAARGEDRSLRNLTSPGVEGEGKFMLNQYLQQRGDANIQTHADLISKARFYTDANFPDRKQAREAAERATRYDASAKLQARFQLQTMLLTCMEEQRLDVLMSPTSTVPPRKLTAPREPTVNGRSAIGFSLIGQQGFPAISVPAGFTTEVWDRVRDGSGTRLVGPVAAEIPVGIDFLARPFEEALLIRVAGAYEAATRHRRPPADFGPLMDEP